MDVNVNNVSSNMKSIVSNLESYDLNKPDEEPDYIKEINSGNGEIAVTTNFGTIIDTYLNDIAYIAAKTSDKPIGAGIFNGLGEHNKISMIITEDTNNPKHYYTLYALASYVPANAVTDIRDDIYGEDDAVNYQEIASNIVSTLPEDELNYSPDICEYIDCSSDFEAIKNVDQLLELMNVTDEVTGERTDKDQHSAFDW